jgi:elongation factor P--(R)-beta-lysine ligase
MSKNPSWKKYHKNESFGKILEYRAKIKELTFEFFRNQGFLEIDFPSLIKAPAVEDHLELFEVNIKHASQKTFKGFLSGSPELQIKKSVIAGFEKPFTFAKVFRNGDPFDFSHNTEFTMLEWYRKHRGYKEVTQDLINLLQFLAQKTVGIRKARYLLGIKNQKHADQYFDNPGDGENTKNIKTSSCDIHYRILNLKPTEILWKNTTIDIANFEWVSIPDLFRKTFNKKLDSVFENLDTAKQFAGGQGFNVSDVDDLGSIFFKIFIEQVEKDICTKPVVLMDFPYFEGALAMKNKNNSFFVERSETFLAGFEIGNAYTELADWKEQLQRFKQSYRYRKQSGLHTIPVDWDYINALKFENEINPRSRREGFAGGIGTGFERICQILLNVEDISDIIFNPAMEMWDVHT